MKHQVISIFLALTMLLPVLASCTPNRLDTDQTTEELKTVYPNVKVSEMEFTLSEKDVEKFERKLKTCKELYDSNLIENAAELEKQLYQLNSLLMMIEVQEGIAYLQYCYDFSDPKAKENYEYAVTASNQANTDFWSLKPDEDSPENVLNATVLAFLDKEYAYVRMEKGAAVYYAEELDALTVAVNAYNGEGTPQEIYDLYVEYWDTAKQYAQRHGYDNYYDCISRVGYMRDYGRSEREEFRSYVKTYLIPLFKKLRDKSQQADAVLTPAQYQKSIAYSKNRYDSFSENYLFSYFESLPESGGKAMMEAFEKDRILIGDQPNSRFQGFTTMVGNTPICYFCADEMDMTAVSHEIGHYYSGSVNPYDDSLTMDLKEIHSQANSLLLYSYLQNHLDDPAFDSFCAYEIYNMVYQTISCTIRDEFDEKVFGAGGKKYTVPELNQIMADLLREYGVANLSDHMVEQLSTYWHRLGLTHPGYEISYAVSLVASLQIYQKSLEDYDGATESYCNLVENLNMEQSFVEKLAGAGLSSPFERSTFVKLNKLGK
ncbi:MAG: hypothetical protein IJW98_06320 [Clostridia bacterium]|nr:hypothetical protein [Clostridia bacterium]